MSLVDLCFVFSCLLFTLANSIKPSQKKHAELISNLAVAVRVSGFLPQPVDGVEVLVRGHVRERLIQEVHQVPGAVHLLSGRGAADA